MPQLLVAFAFSLFAVATGAQEPKPTSGVAADTAVLIIHNRPIAVFRAPIGALAPNDRAVGSRRRLEALFERGRFDSVSTRNVPEGVLVLVGEERVFTITPADVDTLAGERLDALAA
jgi:hypothetical protein